MKYMPTSPPAREAVRRCPPPLGCGRQATWSRESYEAALDDDITDIVAEISDVHNREGIDG